MTKIDFFSDLDANSEDMKSRDEMARVPFPYPGGKSRSVKKILPHLPHSNVYVEPFGGSGAVLLAKLPCKLDVFNDKYAGVVAFYRCVRNKDKMDALCEILDLTIHSREDFLWCKETWFDQDDDVERAARWYYMMNYSFGSLARNWGRSTSGNGLLAGKIQRKLPLFYNIHKRLKNVQIENQDWQQCIKDYDNPDTVFYLDPPYVDTDVGIYKNKMSHDDHRRLISTVFNSEAFCAVSGYSNPLYENNDWDDRIVWKSYISIKSAAYTETNRKKKLEGIETRGYSEEILWIKEAN